MKAHHIKHAGFFLAILMIVSNVLIIASQVNNARAITLDPGESKVRIWGTSSGVSVSSSPSGINNCTSTCEAAFPESSSVTLTASVPGNMAIKEWSFLNGVGQCSQGVNHNGSTCTITTAAEYGEIAAYPKAYFKQPLLKASKKGSGSGTISSSPSGISCGSDCNQAFGVTLLPNQDGNTTKVTLKAAPSAGSKFAGWATYGEGGCECLNPGTPGKGGSYSTVRVTKTSCDVYLAGWTSTSGPAIAYFEKDTSSGSSGSSSGGTSNNNEPADDDSPADQKEILEQDAVEGFKLNGQDVVVEGENGEDKAQKLSFSQSDPIKLSGKTVPNGIVKLFIFSDPQEAEVTADSEGYWEYIIENIEPGEHRVEVAVTDPVTNKTTEQVVLGEFTVAQAGTNSQSLADDSESSDNGSSNLAVIAGASVLIVIAVAYIFWYWWHHKDSILSHHKKTTGPESETVEPDENQ